MSDLMVGLLFVFIILVLYFALQFRQTTETLSGANNTRAKILRELETALRDRGVEVTIDTDTGVLRLPEEVLFDTGAAVLNAEGTRAVGIVAEELARVLPCYTYPRRAGCPEISHRIDALFVEGHTDRDPMSGTGLIRDNLDLSVVRATNTYRALTSAAPLLDSLRSEPSAHAPRVLSVSGYGESRPVDDRDSEEAKRNNRRIDLRFLMITPRSPMQAGAEDMLVKGP